MQTLLRAVFAALAALLISGFWQTRLLSQTMWTPRGSGRLIGVTLGCTVLSALIVWLRPKFRLPVFDWFDLPIGAAVLATIFGLAAHFPINTRWLWTPIGIAFVIYLLRNRTTRIIAMTRTEWAAFSLAGFSLLLHLLAALSPESSGDGLAMHLVIPEWIAAHHSWSFDATRLAWAVMPMNGDWLASFAFLIGGEYASKLLNWIWLVAICAGLFRVLSAHLPRERAWFAVALFASTPVAFLVTTSLFVENLWALFLFAGLLAIWEDRPIASAILLGAAMATKFGSLPMVLMAAPLLIWKLRARPWKTSALWISVFAAFACIPYVTAYAITGNPVFPFFNGTFHSPLFEDRTMIDGRFPRGVTWRILYDLTIHTSRYLESQDGAAGFAWLLFVPLTVLSWKRMPTLARLCLATTIGFVVMEFQAFTYLRYAYPALVLLTIPIALVITRDRWLAAGAAIVFCLNIYFLAASDYQHRDLFLNWFDAAEREQYMEFYTPQRKLIRELNRVAPGQTVAFLAGNQIAGVQATVYSASWHSWKFENALRNAVAPDDVLKLIERFGIRYVIAPTEVSAVQMASVQARDMLNLCTEKQMESGGFQLARVLDTCKADSRPAAKPGTYDDKDLHILYRGAWIRDSQFPQTFEHTITYSATPGESFRVAFSGSKISWIFTKASNRGIAQVLIDGVERESIDLYAALPEWQARRSFAAAGDGLHTFEVRVTGRKNRAASDIYVDIDGYIVE